MYGFNMPGFTALNSIYYKGGRYSTVVAAGHVRAVHQVSPAVRVGTVQGGRGRIQILDPCQVTCRLETVLVCDDPCAD